jgi:hypothetical protein
LNLRPLPNKGPFIIIIHDQYRTIKEQQEEEDRLMTDEDRKERDECYKRFFAPTPEERRRPHGHTNLVEW